MHNALPATAALLFLLLVPTTSALHTPSPTWSVWTGETAPPLARSPAAPGVDLSVVARPMVFLEAVGDLDGDGAVEFVMESIDAAQGVARYTAVGGPALETVHWTVDAAQGQIMSVASDLDGDGIMELLSVTNITGAASGIGQAVGGLAAQRFEVTGALTFAPTSGLSATAMFEAAVGTSLATLQAALLPVEGLGPAIGHATTQLGALQATGQGVMILVLEQVETTTASLGAVVTSLSDTTAQTALSVKVLGLDGNVRGEVVLEDIASDPLGLGAPDLDLDGVPDVVVLLLNEVAPTEGLPVGIPELRAYAGADASLSWSLQTDVAQGVPMLIPRLGDVTGDGAIDVGIQVVAGAAAELAADTGQLQSLFHLVDGATGQITGTLEATDGIVAAIPFGDVVGGTGDELLRVVTDAQGAALREVALLDAVLQPIWSLSLPADAVPLNLDLEAHTRELQGFTDLTGDGLADIAITAGVGADGVMVRVHNGVNGSVVWEEVLPRVTALVPLENLSGVGATDLAVVQAAVDARVQVLTLLRGADGVPVWELPLVPAALAEAMPAATQVLPSVKSVGDVTGDGVAELVVRTEFLFEGTAEATIELDGREVAVGLDAAAHTFLLDGRTGETLYAHSDEVAAGAGARAELPELGAAEPLSGFQDVPAEEEERSTPGPAMFLLLATLTLAAAVAPRRR